MNRTSIIQNLIDKNNYKSYLEIGVQKGKNFEAIKCDRKVGVDPDTESKATSHLTSDLFLEMAKIKDTKFDIIFVDGLHHSYQVMKDILNSLDCLNEGGTIVCHDINPITKESQQVPRIQSHWNGDCWKAWVMLRATRSDLLMVVVNVDEGCGIITKGKQKKIKIDCDLTYENLEKNRVEWLNLREPQSSAISTISAESKKPFGTTKEPLF